MRLVKYAAGTSTYVLATTLLDRQRYRVRDLCDNAALERLVSRRFGLLFPTMIR